MERDIDQRLMMLLGAEQLPAEAWAKLHRWVQQMPITKAARTFRQLSNPKASDAAILEGAA
jgi:hypothetical protein